MAETPEQTRDRLIVDLNGRRPDVQRLYAYYRGDHPLPWAPADVRDAFLALMNMARSNWCRLIVQAPTERLRVLGIRFGDDPEDGQSDDVDVWRRLWQGNRLDAQSRLVHSAACIARRGFVLVWPDVDDPGAAPKIVPERPDQVIVDYEPGCPTERRAALKMFTDQVARVEYVTLWTEDGVYNWQRPVAVQAKSNLAIITSTAREGGWKPWADPEEGIVPEAANPLGCVPVVEFQAHPELTGEPLSELDGGVTDVQDRINKTVLDRLVTSNFSSFQQKWATGLEIPVDENDRPIEPFQAAVDRLWVNEDPAGKFGSFEVASLENYIKSVEADIQHLAATTRTPPHYLLGQSGQPASGDALKAAETGLIAKVLEIRDSYTESWEEVIRLALKADDDPRFEDQALSLVWKDPESRSDAEKMDAATKMQAVGVPWESIMEYLGYSPTEIKRMDAQRAEDAANGLLDQQAPMALGPGPRALPAPQGPPERPTPGL